MIFRPNNTKGKKIKILDARGTEVMNVVKYDSETREAKILLLGKAPKGANVKKSMLVSGNPSKSYEKTFAQSVVYADVVLKGSRIYVDGKKY